MGDVRFRFGRDDLLRTRFAIAPLIELVAATYVVRQPRLHPQHRRWTEHALPRLQGLDLGLLFAVTPLGRSAWPNFNAPPPVVPQPGVADELARVAGTDPNVVRADVLRAWPDGVPPDAQPFVDDPAAALAALVAQMELFWAAALEPWWGRMASLLEGEIAARAMRLVQLGGRAAFADLDPQVTWTTDTLVVHRSRLPELDLALDGRGLLLVPSVLAFGVWPRVEPTWEPALTYQPPGTGDLWSPEVDRAAAVAALLGRRRAALLLALDRPASTADLAARTGWSAGGVNTHLTALRRCGLVVRRRTGRSVLYSRTSTGEAVIGSGASRSSRTAAG